MQTIERTTLSELVGNEQYARKVLPFIRGEYFSDRTERIVFEEIQKFVERYNALPTKSTLEIEIDSRRDLNEDDIRRVLTVVKELENDKDVNFDWLVDTTEKFCKDKAVYNAIVEGIQIIDGKDKTRGPDAIPSYSHRCPCCGFR
jgi:ABC-type transporter MlaC component